ncbi:oxygen-independent coproporphyrinogen III oxidase [Mesobaculum littorinae]|uniref:Coproporphyrinogen-III oxidase n=1 Tax=Mesobaculum littorinae TaxID=2486419 RepID=A0A438AE73_9RHOB|nr:oxygen-independent coproporphyrinogen III oxidase [Mesobaculum littorinae]RVV97006.1 oxygen-independent coproporphyrinogen III oxidase [Mesobaculum littorinae]
MTEQSQLRRLGLFDTRVPRYTSYPTAPHFGAGVTADTVAGWMRAIPENGEVSVYVHIPFCRRLCWFCACRTQGTATGSPIEGYLDSLRAELQLLRRNLAPGVRLSRLHFGGGTPTLLSPEQFLRLTRDIEAITPRAPGSEISVEVDPNELDDARLDALAEAGMTRASIGVQDFDPEIQDCIGRRQSWEVTKSAVDGLRARGITSLNADILYGLPHQTPERIAASVQKLLSLSPDRVALFGYAHVPWMARRQSLIPTDALPGPESRLKLYEVARQLFVWDGYAEIGIDHFARPDDGLEIARRTGGLRRNFQGYTDDRVDTLIGLGASSISRYPQGYAQNATSTGAYQKVLAAHMLPIQKGHALSDEDRLRGAAIEALMCDFSADAATLAQRTGLPQARAAAILATLPELCPEIVSHAPGRVWLEPGMRPLVRIAARALDAYAMNPSGHSLAV